MPSARWYLQRLRAMSPMELPWRAWRIGRARAGSMRRWPTATDVEIGVVWSGSCTSKTLVAREVNFPFTATPEQMATWPTEWRERCLSEAGDMLAHRFSFFMFEREPFGDAIDWHCDYASGKRVPLDYSGRLDYRDSSRVGDVKVTWELSRMQHLTRLAQAWRWSRDERFPREIVAQITNWIENNPWMYGINWTSSMECALRLISWTCAFHWIRDWSGLTDAFCRLLVASIHQHLATISSSYSLFSSANNHLIAEAGGAFMAASYWSGLTHARQWKEQARHHLVRECLRQNHPDGVNFEHTFPYQFFVWDLLLIPALMGRSLGEDFPPEYWDRLEKMAEFLAWLSDSSGNTPNVGDQDDGVTLNAGGDFSKPVRSVLALAGRVFKRSDFLACSGPQLEEKSAWLLGPITTPRHSTALGRRSRSFPIGGYHVLRSNQDPTFEALLLFDVAPIGDSVTGVHGHADALSIILHLDGQPFLSDPGTYSYQNTPLRHFFRATAQHNTLCFEGHDQAEYLNRFMWGRRPNVKLICCDFGAEKGIVAGRVKWWTGGVHERRVEFDFEARWAQLHDSWHGGADAFLNFTVAPQIQVSRLSERECRLTGERVSLMMDFVDRGVELSPMEFSPRCYRKQQATRIRVPLPEQQGNITTTLTWEIRD